MVINTLNCINAETNHWNSAHYKKVNYSTQTISTSISRIDDILSKNIEIDEQTYYFYSAFNDSDQEHIQLTSI